ncbi:hypothetical protein B4110_0306 [Parageobacillus toebii]|uniref:Uncharacterized protein n=1 Tax=Parageobacillus toebii TaxID=153151 RepID=A0A150MT88_9BACL|nr:hypothetical protein B4168_0431 [Anoxybacillus flavithermus]KYD27684.1 hypothetical protein B4110_0306 [Parageobacillus toebii]OAO88994.1 hypothetical protein GT23_0014 [Parageobacillus thermoglucosidasius]
MIRNLFLQMMQRENAMDYPLHCLAMRVKIEHLAVKWQKKT